MQDVAPHLATGQGMAKILRPVTPQREPMSGTALEVLHVLEPVLGRIIAMAVLKYACKIIEADVAKLTPRNLIDLIPPIERSLTAYDRLDKVEGALRALAERSQSGGGAG